MNNTWDQVPPKFPKKALRDTLSAFQVTNEELLSSNKSAHSVRENSLVVKVRKYSKIFYTQGSQTETTLIQETTSAGPAIFLCKDGKNC